MKEIIKCDRNKKEKRRENEKKLRMRKSLCVESILEENKYIKH